MQEKANNTDDVTDGGAADGVPQSPLKHRGDFTKARKWLKNLIGNKKLQGKDMAFKDLSEFILNAISMKSGVSMGNLKMLATELWPYC